MSLAFIEKAGFGLGDHSSALIIAVLGLIMHLSLDLLYIKILCGINTKIHNIAFTDKLTFQNNSRIYITE